MTESIGDDDQPQCGNFLLENLLSYKSQLDGKAFHANVMARIEQRSRQRRWVLGGAAILAAIAVIAVKPEEFSFPSTLHLPLENLGAIAAAASPHGSLMAIMLACVFIFGVTKTVDSI
jgi:hypothetical protein